MNKAKRKHLIAEAARLPKTKRFRCCTCRKPCVSWEGAECWPCERARLSWYVWNMP